MLKRRGSAANIAKLPELLGRPQSAVALFFLIRRAFFLIRRAPFGARTPTDQEPDHPARNARAHTRCHSACNSDPLSRGIGVQN